MSPDKRYVCAGGNDGYLYYIDMSKVQREKEAEDDQDKAKNGVVQKVKVVKKWKPVLSLAFGQDEGGSGGGGAASSTSARASLMTT